MISIYYCSSKISKESRKLPCITSGLDSWDSLLCLTSTLSTQHDQVNPSPALMTDAPPPPSQVDTRPYSHSQNETKSNILVVKPFWEGVWDQINLVPRVLQLLNLVTRVLRVFGQQLVARRDWRISITTCIVLPQKSCGNKIPVPQPLLAINCCPKCLRTPGRRLPAPWSVVGHR